MSIAERERMADNGDTARGGKASMGVEDAMASLASLDLTAVKRKVVDEKGWSGKIADYAELR